MNNDARISIILSEAATIAAGYPLRGSAVGLESGRTPYIQLKNVDPDTGVDWGSVDRVKLPKGRRGKGLSKGQVIFAARGSRNFAYSLSEAPQGAVCAPHFFVLTLKDSAQILPEFLVWQINQKPCQDYLRRTAVGSSTTTTVRRPALEAMPLNAPSIETQIAIIKFWRAAQREQAVFNQIIANTNKQLDAIALGLQSQSRRAHQ